MADDVVAWPTADADDMPGCKALMNQALREHVRRKKTRNSISS